MNAADAVSVLILLAAMCLVWSAVIAWRSPEFKRDVERLREQKRIRKAAKR